MKAGVVTVCACPACVLHTYLGILDILVGLFQMSVECVRLRVRCTVANRVKTCRRENMLSRAVRTLWWGMVSEMHAAYVHWSMKMVPDALP